MADLYWVGGNATWDSTIGTKWSGTSGGAGGWAVPTASDNVFFDANSGTSTVTLSGTRSCLNFNTTGFTGTFNGVSTPTLSISGDSCILGADMYWNIFSGPTLNALSTLNLQTNGVAPRAVQCSSSATILTLLDDLTCGTLTLSLGTFDANDFNVDTDSFSSTGGFTRILNMGNGTWTISGNATAWNTTSSLTIEPEGATLEFIGTTPGAVNITANAKITAPVIIRPPTHATNRMVLSGTGGFSNLTVEEGNVIQLSANIIIDNGEFRGTGERPILLDSSLITVARTLTVEGEIRGRYVGVRDISKGGTGTIHFSPGSIYGGNVAGVTTAPATPHAHYSMGI